MSAPMLKQILCRFKVTKYSWNEAFSLIFFSIHLTMQHEINDSFGQVTRPDVYNKNNVVE